VSERIDPNEYDDPANPPPGYKAIECPDCSLNYMKPSQAPRMSLGPISGVALGADRAASFCTACRGRRWVWWPLSAVQQGGGPVPRQNPNGEAGPADETGTDS